VVENVFDIKRIFTHKKAPVGLAVVITPAYPVQGRL